jgi:hypothetical protein
MHRGKKLFYFFIVICHGLDCPGTEFQRGKDFLHPSSLLYNEYQVYFPGVKHVGCGIDHLPPFSTEGMERIEVYLYSPSGP